MLNLIIAGKDVSGLVKDQGIVRGVTYRNEKDRVTLSGKRYTNRVRKLVYEISFEPMAESDIKSLLESLEENYVPVQYKDPVLGLINKKFIPEIGELELSLEDKDGVSYWSGFVLGLEEQ